MMDRAMMISHSDTMATRKKKPGRKQALTRELVDKIVSEVRRVFYAKWAIRNLGYSERVLYRWLGRGEAEIERMESKGLTRPKRTEAVYVHLVREFKKAQAANIRAHATNWQRGALGQERKILINEKTGQPVLDGSGNVIVLQEEIEPDPRLSKDYLARVDHEHYGPKVRTEITTPDGGPSELQITVVKKRRVTARPPEEAGI